VKTPRIFAICGGAGSGKTTTLLRLSESLGGRGLRVGGVLQVAVQDGDLRVGYDLLDVATGEEFAFARRRSSYRSAGLSFTFDPQGWEWAALRIQHAAAQADVVVVDELGKLEARGSGHLPALRSALAAPSAATWFLAVRDLALERVAAELGPLDQVFYLEIAAGERLVERLALLA
jgi:nucleoside-triphosphatase THEP1